METDLAVLWVGHAGILVRTGSTIIAVDPFLVGEFQWNGQIERYLGQSPWIGAGANARAFVEKFASSIQAVCITHNHGDHFDPWTIVALKERNPALHVIAPRAIISWLLRSSAFGDRYKPNLIWVRPGHPCVINPGQTPLVVEAFRDSKRGLSRFPHRVGYLIHPPGRPGIAHLGDAHRIGVSWRKILHLATGIVTWDKISPEKVASFFDVGGTLKHVWPIHWEAFKPGKFDCNKDPQQYIDGCKNSGVPTSILSYTEWRTLG